MNKITTRTLPNFMDGRSIGFDRMFDLLDDAVAFGGTTTYPPYNVIEVDKDNYQIELALAGFSNDDLTITQDRNKLRIEGNKPTFEGDEPKYLHKGISNRAFTREFVLADHVYVDGAEFADGIVTIKLHRELPEEMKPRQIEILRLENKK